MEPEKQEHEARRLLRITLDELNDCIAEVESKAYLKDYTKVSYEATIAVVESYLATPATAADDDAEALAAALERIEAYKETVSELRPESWKHDHRQLLGAVCAIAEVALAAYRAKHPKVAAS